MSFLLKNLLDFLFPRAASVAALENMSAAELWRLPRAANAGRAGAPDTIALFDYKHPLMRAAIWELKYRGNPTMAKLFAQCLYDELSAELVERKLFEHFNRPLLVPVPISEKRRAERGFNQCELLAAALGALDGGRFFEVRANLLIRVRHTESQTRKNRADRLNNLKDCFSVARPEALIGRTVILLDDVTTTGATFDEAGETLRRAGAEKIIKVAIAH